MFDTAKIYIYGIVAAIVAGFLAVFKYRGDKIERQDREIETMKQNHESKEKASDYEKQNVEAAAKAENEEHADITNGTIRI